MVGLGWIPPSNINQPMKKKKEGNIKWNFLTEVKITSNIQKVQAKKVKLMSNMWDLESIQMENANQLEGPQDWKITDESNKGRLSWP